MSQQGMRTFSTEFKADYGDTLRLRDYGLRSDYGDTLLNPQLSASRDYGDTLADYADYGGLR
jgi:hypothetical protein